MIIRHKKPFFRGLFLLIGFFIVFFFLLTPMITVDGEKLTGLQYSDHVFNELSKGSSNFLELAEQAAASMKAHYINVAIALKADDPQDLQTRLLRNAGGENIRLNKEQLSCTVNLGRLLAQATSDAKLLYNNEEDRLFAKYAGIPPLEVAKAWWTLLTPLARQLQMHKQLAESNAINTVIRRAIEPGNNYFGIPAEKISDNLLLIGGFLLFYIIYTIWYGFAIYEIFAGFGLMASNTEEDILEEN